MASANFSDSDSCDEWDVNLYGPPTLPGGLAAYDIVKVWQRKTRVRDVIAAEIIEIKKTNDKIREAQEKKKVTLKNSECQTKISGDIVASQTFTVGISDKVLFPSSSITKLYSYFRDKYYLVEKDWPTSLHSENKRDEASQTTLTGDVYLIKKVDSHLENEKGQPTEPAFEIDESSGQLYVIVP